MSPTVRLAQTLHGPMYVLGADVFISRSLELYGEYSEGEVELLRQLIAPDAVIVEAGANLGALTLPLARLCPAGKVIAFEPQQPLMQLLCANLVLNGLANVEVHADALGAAAGRTRLSAIDYGGAGNFGGVKLGGEGEAVAVTRLDDLDLPRCDLIKADVEGYEAEVLRGAAGLIARTRPALYLENDRAASQGPLIALVAAWDYDAWWHVVPMFRPQNLRGRSDNVFGETVSLNILCLPRERGAPVTGLERIDPGDWRSPVTPA